MTDNISDWLEMKIESFKWNSLCLFRRMIYNPFLV